MKTVVITGSSRGLGWEMARCFRKSGMNVVLNGANSDRLQKAKQVLEAVPGDGKVIACYGDVCSTVGMQALIDNVVAEFGVVDIWINNAGVNQPIKSLWNLSDDEINQILGVDLKGTVIGSKLAMSQMIRQGVGRLSPGIMITDFITTALGGKEKIDLPEKTKKFYNIVGDSPDVVANFLVAKILKNKKNNVHIQWLTTAKVMRKF